MAILHVGPGLHYSVDLRIQTYAVPVPLKYRELVHIDIRIFFTVYNSEQSYRPGDPSTPAARDNPVTLTFDRLISGSTHALGLWRLSTLVLIAQAVFLLECGQGHRRNWSPRLPPRGVSSLAVRGPFLVAYQNLTGRGC